MSSEQVKKILARIPADLHERAKKYAEEHHISLNALIVESIEEYIDTESVSREEFDNLKRVVEQIEKIIKK
jgi:hypothetical protein